MEISNLADPRFAPATSLSGAIETRFSCRAFLDQPVDGALLREVLQQAARAPSGGNLQPWRLYAVGGAELDALKAQMRERLRRKPSPDTIEYPIYPASLDEPYRSSRYKVGEDMYALLGIARENKIGRLTWLQSNYEFFGAPVGLFCYVDRRMGSAQWSDLGMYLQTLMLLLRERGLHSCPQECWSVYNALVSEFVEAPKEWMLFCGVAVGYADPDAAVNRLRADRMALEGFASFRGI